MHSILIPICKVIGIMDFDDNNLFFFIFIKLIDSRHLQFSNKFKVKYSIFKIAHSAQKIKCYQDLSISQINLFHVLNVL